MPRTRAISGVVRLLTGVAVLSSIITQIVDDLTHNAFEPEHYFAYFTIQSGLINVVVLLVGGWLALRVRSDPALFTAIRMSTVPYAVVTAVVYNALLRGIPTVGYEGVQWPNEVLHVWVPIIIVLDWVLAPGRPTLAWKTLWITAAYPLAWVAFTLVRGFATGWFPYPFLEPATGFVSVCGYIVGIAVFIIGVGALAVWVSRVGRRGSLSEASGVAGSSS